VTVGRRPAGGVGDAVVAIGAGVDAAIDPEAFGGCGVDDGGIARPAVSGVGEGGIVGPAVSGVGDDRESLWSVAGFAAVQAATRTTPATTIATRGRRDRPDVSRQRTRRADVPIFGQLGADKLGLQRTRRAYRGGVTRHGLADRSAVSNARAQTPSRHPVVRVVRRTDPPNRPIRPCYAEPHLSKVSLN